MGDRYSRWADRARCHRQDNPLPRGPNDELVAMYIGLTVPQISRETGWREGTVRAWLNRARRGVAQRIGA